MSTNTPTSDTPALRLQAGELLLQLSPELGGALTGLWLQGQPLLQAGPAAALVQVPLAGARAPASFDWKGRHYTAAADQAVPLSHWTVEESSATRAVLECTCPSSPAWPFALHVAQQVQVTPGSVRLDITATNIDARNAPMGLGWCLALPRAGCSLQLQAQGAAVDGAVQALNLNQSFEGWQGQAQVRFAAGSLRLSSSLGRVLVHTAAGADHWVFAPTSHAPQALGSADPLALGLLALQPGESASAWLQLDVLPAA